MFIILKALFLIHSCFACELSNLQLRFENTKNLVYDYKHLKHAQHVTAVSLRQQIAEAATLLHDQYGQNLPEEDRSARFLQILQKSKAGNIPPQAFTHINYLVHKYLQEMSKNQKELAHIRQIILVNINYLYNYFFFFQAVGEKKNWLQEMLASAGIPKEKRSAYWQKTPWMVGSLSAPFPLDVIKHILFFVFHGLEAKKTSSAIRLAASPLYTNLPVTVNFTVLPLPTLRRMASKMLKLDAYLSSSPQDHARSPRWIWRLQELEVSDKSKWYDQVYTSKYILLAKKFLLSSLAMNVITDRMLKEIPQAFPNLISLNLSFTHDLEKVTQSQITLNKKIKNFTVIHDISQNIQFPSLYTLNENPKPLPKKADFDEVIRIIDFDEVTDEGINALSNLPFLQEINLSGRKKITDNSIFYLAQLPRLKTINLQGCVQITQAGIENFIKQAKAQISIIN